MRVLIVTSLLTLSCASFAKTVELIAVTSRAVL